MQTYRLAAATIVSLAIALQYYLVMTGHIGPGPVGRTINFFSYFTILSNGLVVLAMALPVMAPASAAGLFFMQPAVRAGILVYIGIVCAVYGVILRHLWQPQGWQFVADAILHYGTPLLYLLDWLLFVPKGSLRIKHALAWLGFPLAYVIWTFVHGAVSGFYPYPFVNVAALGYAAVLLNIAGLFVVFAGFGLALIGVDRVLRAVSAKSV